MMLRAWRSFIVLALASSSFWMTACTVGTPSLDTTSYQPVNTACENIDLGAPTFTVTTWRLLVHCLNSYGALDPIDHLNQKLSDSDLQPIVDSVSKYLLNQSTTLYELEQSYLTYESQGQLDKTLANLGNFLSNDEFVVSSLILLKDAYYEKNSSVFGLFSNSTGDPNFLTALQYLAPKFNPGNVNTGIDVGMTVAVAPAFTSLQKKFRAASPDGRALQDLTNDVMSYIQDPNPNKVQVGARTIEGLIRGDLFQALDDAIGGGTSQALQGGINRLSSVFRVSMGGDGAMFDGMTSLFGAMHKPLYCMKGTQTVADGDMFILSELIRQTDANVANYMRVENPLLLISVNPFCDYPPELAQDYPTMIQLANTSAMVPGADLMKALYRPVYTSPITGEHHPLAELFVDMAAEGTIKDVIPVLNELTLRGIWDDALLMATIPPEEDRETIENALKYIYDPIPSLGTVSVYDILMNSMQRIAPADFYRFMLSMNTFTNSDVPIAQPLLQSLRDFNYMNDAHPVVSLIQQVLQDAPNNAGLFQSIFTSMNYPEFQQSIQLMSAMAKDGRLKQVVDVMFALLHRVGAPGATPINPVVQPPFIAFTRHNFDETDLTPYPISTTTPDPADPCSNLNLTFGVDQFTDPNYTDTVNTTVQCLSNDLGDQSLMSDIQFLESKKSDDNGLNFFQFPIQLIENLNLAKPELDYLSNAFLRNFDTGFFFNLLDVAPYFISDQIAPPAGSVSAFATGPVLQPLFDLASPLITGDAKAQLDYDENYLASELLRPDFPQTLGFADTLFNETNEPAAPVPVITTFDQERLQRWVNNFECENAKTPQEIDLRATQIVDDFDNAVNNWDLQNGEPRRTWPFADFKSELAQTFQKLGDPTLNATDESLTQAFLNIMQHFTLQPGQPPNQVQHFTVDDLIQFFKQRSEDYQLITFYYTDENGNFEQNPRVKLVSTLDRLELVMIAADFDISILGLELAGNSSLKYGMELALAWGDEPRAIWPPKIQAMFPDSAPKKIQDVITEMDEAQGEAEDLVGFPNLPQCKMIADPNDPIAIQKMETSWPKNRTNVHLPEIGFFKSTERSLYNNHEVLSVMSENSPASTGPNVNGLKIMREVFYELYFSTLPEDRSMTLGPSNDWRNNVKLADEITRMGIFRMIGQKLRAFKGTEQDLHDAFAGILTTGALPQTADALNALLVNGAANKQELFWAAVQSVFNVFDSSEGVYTDDEKAQLAAMTPAQQKAQKEEWVREAARMKQMAYYGLAAGGKLNFTGPLLGAVASVVNTYSDFLTENAGDIETVLRSDQASSVMRGLYQEPNPANQTLVASLLTRALSDPKVALSAVGLLQAINQDSTAQNSWTLFRNRLDALKAEQVYQPYSQYFDTFGTDLISFFSNQTSDSEALSASNHIRSFSAQMLQQGDIDQFLQLVKDDPAKSYQVLQTLSRYIDNGQLQQFFDLVRRSLSAPTR
jgi:hypothetical protein